MRDAHPGVRGGQDSASLPRRVVLGGALALAAAACRPPGQASGQPDPPGLVAVNRAIENEERLISDYEAARRHHRGLASRIEPVIAEHRAHLRALRGRVSPSPQPAGAGTPSPTSTATPAKTIPSERGEVVAALVERERAAAEARLRDLVEAPPFVAQLLASIGAAEATHAAILTDSS